MTEDFQQELLELLPKEAIIELFKQRIVLTEEEFAEALSRAVDGVHFDALKSKREYCRAWRESNYYSNPAEYERVKERWRSEYRERRASMTSEQIEAERERRRNRIRNLTSEQRERYRATRNSWQREDRAAKMQMPEYREKIRRQSREWHARKRAEDPEWVERNRKYHREYYARKKAEKEAMKNEQEVYPDADQ